MLHHKMMRKLMRTATKDADAMVVINEQVKKVIRNKKEVSHKPRTNKGL